MGEELKATAVENTEKLPFLTKISYGCTAFANMLTSIIVNSYLIYFYTNGLGLSGTLAGTLSLIGSVWGWICTVAGGVIIDSTGAKKGGKCRNFIIKFLIPGTVLMVLQFAIPQLSNTMTIVWLMVAYMGRCAAWAFVQQPATVLMGRITKDKVQRSHLNQVYTIMSVAGSYLSVAFTMPFVERFGTDMPGVRKGFAVIAVIYGIVFLVMYMLAYIGTKGYEPEEEYNETLEKKPGILEMLKGVVTNKMALIAILLYLVDLIGCAMESFGQVYYFQYNLGDMGRFTYYSTITTATAILAMLVAGRFVKQFGNAGTAIVGGVISASAYLVRFLAQDVNFMQWAVCIGIASFGAGLVANVGILCLFDSVTYGEYKNGVNNQGLLVAAYSLGNTIALAIGRAAVAFLLDTVTFDPQAAEQSAEALRLFRLENTFAPFVGFVLVILIGVVLKGFERKLPEMQRAIDERKTQNA